MSVAAAVAPLARALARATLAAMPVIFHIPDVDTEIEDDLVDLLLEELTLTARPDAPFDGEQAARTIGHARGGAMAARVHLTDSEHLAVLRVLDNLRRCGGLHRDLLLLRDRLVGSYAPSPVDYSVRRVSDWVNDDAFTSYAGTFAVGDRLLLKSGGWRVTAVERDERNDRNRLVCRPFGDEE